MDVQRESYERAAVIERERVEMLRREKLLELRLQDTETKLKQAELLLKFYRDQETKP